jgi:hypothetical protein
MKADILYNELKQNWKAWGGLSDEEKEILSSPDAICEVLCMDGWKEVSVCDPSINAVIRLSSDFNPKEVPSMADVVTQCAENDPYNPVGDIKRVGEKHDDGKARHELIYYPFIIGVAQVLTFGAKKYADNSWQNLPARKARYYAATMRHLIAYWMGFKEDDESGLSHLDHAATNLMFLKYDEDESKKEDDQ